MSDFGSLSVGLSGLLAHRRALDVAGHNLANVNTPGYSRQRVDLSAQTNPTAAAIFARTNGTGTGVRAGTAYRITDQFMEIRVLQEHGANASLEQTQSVLGQIENTIDEPSDTGLSAQINTFMAAWHDVANRPDDLAARRQLVETASTLTASFGQLDGSLKTLGENTLHELQSTVADVNTTATAVADLNNRILTAVTADMPAGDLMDQRDALVRSLSEQVGVTVRPQENGVVDVYVGAMALVRGNRSDALRVDTTTTPGTTAIVWDRLGLPATVGGSAGAAQVAINTSIPGYRTELTAVAQTLTTDVNAIHTTGFDLSGSAGVPFFVMGPTGISVNPTIASDPTKVAAADNGSALRDGSVAAKIADLAGPAKAYASFVQRMGVEARTVNRQVSTQSVVTEKVDAAREATSGVNIDEEMANMVAIQHAYSASARFLTAVDSMLETLIKNTGLVGR